MEKLFYTLSGVFGLTAVALGAFGAHGLQSRLAAAADATRRLEWWHTAAHYHLVHALAIALAAHLVHRTGALSATVAGWCFVGGVAVFSGSLYVMTLTGVRALGAITPLGGLSLIVGWGAVIVAARHLV